MSATWLITYLFLASCVCLLEFRANPFPYSIPEILSPYQRFPTSYFLPQLTVHQLFSDRWRFYTAQIFSTLALLCVLELLADPF